MANSGLKKGRYTQHPNKIGLYNTTKGGFIKNDNDVVLSFPFKDTVLEAGMTKEDVGRDERFLHLELDSKDIDTLIEPKVLTDFKYINESGEKQLNAENNIEFFDKNGDLQQNLLIKGNNLLALYTLREKLAGKVKLIYIDPPYNTGSDGFKYNDSFNHSSWLTFMKNRLEVAKELLREDGAIFVQCDDNEQAYLKVLMDEIFGSDNFVNTIVIKMSEATGVKMSHSDKKLPKLKEYIHFYKTGTVNIDTSNILIPVEKMGVNYKSVVTGISREEIDILRSYLSRIDSTEEDIKIFDSIAQRIILKSFSEVVNNWEILSEEEKLVWKQENAYRIVREVSSSSAKKIADVKRLTCDYDFFGIHTKQNKIYLIKNHYNQETRDPNIKLIFAIDYLFVNPCDLWVDIKTTRVDIEGDVEFINGKKPEKILQRIIEMITKKGEIIMDYHLGSGTTAAVAQKMGRKWIGIEQMDYIESLAKERIKTVIAGDKSGISEDYDWKGGGSFVYFELKKYNQEYIDLIEVAKSLKELETLYVDMRNNAFLKFWFDRKEFEKDENFRSLDLNERKKALIEILDENQLYLNYADMDDSRHKVSIDEKTLTNKFYGEN